MKGMEIHAGLTAKNQLLTRFLKYAVIDTQSDPESNTSPSSTNQQDLSRLLVEELHEIGIADACLDKFGYVYASLPSNCGSHRKVAFLAHVDLAHDCSSKGIKPMIHRHYAGGVLTLANGLTLDPDDNPCLKQCLGDTIITSDGNTLLGADDKAGVAEIMEMLTFLQANPQIHRPNIKICFTPDEEIGKGVDNIDLKRLDADFGYTIDGGFVGEVNTENFDAFSAKITFKGVNYHPGLAKDKMVNAARFASLFVSMMPEETSPEHTSGTEGFIHPLSINGDSTNATVQMILRAFSLPGIEKLKAVIATATSYLKAKEPKLEVQIDIKESYRNMGEVMRDRQYLSDFLNKAGQELQINLEYVPIRGGTDGARLSFMGLPCPNIFDGGMNFHSPKEWISHEKMVTTTAFLVVLAQIMV